MKYKVGDKVRVNAKDGASDYIVGKVFNIVRVERGEYYAYRLEGRGEGFCEKEIDLYKKKRKGEVNMNTKRTFRLLKDTPELEKGALVQEACDDGDQEYVVLDENTLSDAAYEDHSDYFDGLPSFSRNTVESQPEWFEEVEMTWIAKVARSVKKKGKK